MAYRDGLIVRGVRHSWDWVKQHMVCRKCRAAVGRPYIHHITGEIDHERVVCGGPARHAIEDEGDLMFRSQHEWLEDEASDRKWQVGVAYGLIDVPEVDRARLYGDDDFEGFE